MRPYGADFSTVACMPLRFDLDLDTTQTLRDPLGLASLWVNRNLEKNGGFETLWVILRPCASCRAYPIPLCRGMRTTRRTLHAYALFN